ADEGRDREHDEHRERNGARETRTRFVAPAAGDRQEDRHREERIDDRDQRDEEAQVLGRVVHALLGAAPADGGAFPASSAKWADRGGRAALRFRATLQARAAFASASAFERRPCSTAASIVTMNTASASAFARPPMRVHPRSEEHT